MVFAVGCKDNFVSNDITPVRSDLTFDEAVDLCGSTIGVDIESYCENNCIINIDDYMIHFYRDYPSHLEELTMPDECGEVFYQPRESQYHIISGISIDGFIIHYFETSEWALSNYNDLVNDVADIDHDIIFGDYDEGYYLMSYMDYHSKQFSAFYYLGDMVVMYNYYFESDDEEDYQRYLVLCDALGLPTSDQITREVMDSAS